MISAVSTQGVFIETVSPSFRLNQKERINKEIRKEIKEEIKEKKKE